jgi:hypothetical protein
MPFWAGSATTGGNLDQPTQEKVEGFLGLIDEQLARIGQERCLYAAQIRLLQPVSFCAFVLEETVLVVATNRNVGAVPSQRFFDLEGHRIDLQTALTVARRDLAFEEPFGIAFARNVLDLPDEQRHEQARLVAEAHIQDELRNAERLRSIMSINPVFRGRDFAADARSVFVLSPLSEPFHTLYNSHVRPVVEGLGYTCMRAEDIYANKPTIEEVWKGINEAQIVIADMTDRNPNVFYMVGMAHTVGKQVILLTQWLNDVPFDLRHFCCIFYEQSPQGMGMLGTNLRNTIEGVSRRG